MPEFQYRVSVDEAMSWQLFKKSLEWELTDRAEAAARDKYGPAFDDLEVDTRVTTEDGHFIVTLTWPDQNTLPATRRVRVSFDVITRRSGTADLDIPMGANVEALLNEHLNKHGTNLVEQGLPEGLVVLQWDVQEPGNHTIETDWVEDLGPEENA